MKILWITNIPLPPICHQMNWTIPNGGGWLYSSLNKLLEDNTEDSFAIATVYSGKEFIQKDINGVSFHLLPSRTSNFSAYNKYLEDYWIRIKQSFGPEIIHIHGTEFPIGLSWIRACGVQGAVVSIQGLVSSIAKYYTGGLDPSYIRRFLTFRDIVRHNNILTSQREFYKRGQFEVELIRSIKHVIGRTEWDRTHVWAINPEARYHYCGETLRTEFYNHKWAYSECTPYTIFISQASYPLKGFHKVLEALPIVLRHYPTTKVYVAGTDITNLPVWRLGGYGLILKKMISKFKLKGHIIFTGNLNEKEMCKQYLKCNVFVCPSSIENSSNSIGEAQLLGMPHIASFVGGVPEIVEYNSKILYRFEEVEMLAARICDVFALKGKFVSYEFDRLRYSSDLNAKYLKSIYREIKDSL